ncbi:MAG TPA: PA2169 family four-helix-bundle protein [Bryobacteraceae bacterium]|nr:PA2169 family four-helix-bundle protein [Bryobacteraceae bacterium]
MIDTDEIRSTLNDLIGTLKDGEQGFRDSADKLRNSDYASKFRSIASERAAAASDLQSEVARLGGKPETSGSASGAMHRGWIGLKAALTGNDDQAILEEAERGEDNAVKNYRDALSKDLPRDIRSLVESQYQQIQIRHNEVRAMRDAARTGTVASTTTGTPRTY